MYFAHLLIPHYPYTVDSQCNIRRPVMSWLNRDTALADAPNDSNTEESRSLRYDEYILQIRCVIKKLTELFQVIKAQGNLDDAIIIVHGDHGSRIVLVEPFARNERRLSRQDYYDGFSTLFAVHSPEITPGYDSQMVGLPRLLKHTVVEPLVSRSLTDGEAAFIYLRDTIEDRTLSRIAMPPIPSRHQ
jgi:arylsulfatase A-like enzyme